MSEPVRVFVSHHHSPEEDAFTARLVADLEAASADVWVDTKGISSGSFVQKISEGLAGRQWLVLVMTPAALASEWVQDEVNAALHQVRGKRMLGVIPFVMTACDEAMIPALWAHLHRYDATKGYELARDALRHALGLPLLPPSQTGTQEPGPVTPMQPPNMPPTFAVPASPHVQISTQQPARVIPAQPVPLAGPAPIDPQPITLPPDKLPPRLSQLGFAAYCALDSIEYILPPVCDVPAGPFLMGSDPKKDKGVWADKNVVTEEMPRHTVSLPGFQIAKFPITVAEYACFVRATGKTAPKGGDVYEWEVSWQTQLRGRLEHPVVMISWHDATAYAIWLAERTSEPWRLPSEAEWEKAARWDAATGAVRQYPWGDKFDASRCNISKGKKRTTTPVGSYPTGASPYGALDMEGNVSEWTSSLFKPYPYVATDGRERAESTEARVLRGTSSGGNAWFARPAHRGYNLPRESINWYGFRLARSVPNA